MSAVGFETAKEWLREKSLTATIKVGSALDALFEGVAFDAVIDVASIQHNERGDMEKIITNIHAALKPGGYLFSVHKNRQDYLYKAGRKLKGITRAIPERTDKAPNSMIISFPTRRDVHNLYSSFSKLEVEKEEWTYENMKKRVSHWIITAQK